MSKSKIIIASIVILSAIAVITFHYGFSDRLDYQSSVQMTDNKAPSPTRQQTVEQLISKLQAEREQDPTFKAESARMERELETEIANMRKALADHRKAQSRLDALTIVQVQYDVEIAQLEKDNQLK